MVPGEVVRGNSLIERTLQALSISNVGDTEKMDLGVDQTSE